MPWIVRPTWNEFTDYGDFQKNNVIMIFSILSSLGWTVNAVAGVCGCLQGESKFNPWTWQGNNIQPFSITTLNNPRGRAYGLPQWDSCNNYINNEQAQSFPGYGPNFSDKPGSENDGTAQCYFINTGFNYYKTSYCPLTFAEFKASTDDPGYLARGWVRNYERPASTGLPATDKKVTERANYWFEFLDGEQPQPPDPGPGPDVPVNPFVGSKGKWWLWLKKEG